LGSEVYFAPNVKAVGAATGYLAYLLKSEAALLLSIEGLVFLAELLLFIKSSFESDWAIEATH
jgi:hypothetical protein